jgi:hypothetical protein
LGGKEDLLNLKGIKTMKTSKRLISLLLALALMLSVCSMMAFAVDEEEPSEEDIIEQGLSVSSIVSYGFQIILSMSGSNIMWSGSPLTATVSGTISATYSASVYPLVYPYTTIVTGTSGYLNPLPTLALGTGNAYRLWFTGYVSGVYYTDVEIGVYYSA